MRNASVCYCSVFVALFWGSAPSFLANGFIVVQGKQGALMVGCSIVEIEWVVLYESVWFLGQLSHSLKGSGFCLLSTKLKMFLFCSCLLMLCYLVHFHVTASTFNSAHIYSALKEPYSARFKSVLNITVYIESCRKPQQSHFNLGGN